MKRRNSLRDKRIRPRNVPRCFGHVASVASMPGGRRNDYSWAKPCHMDEPDLIALLRAMKPTGPDGFEALVAGLMRS